MITASKIGVAPGSALDAAVLDRTEAQWIARARLGDEAAFGLLLAKYRQRAMRLATHVLRRESEAEDVAQEAFIHAFKSLGKLESDVSFSTWLFRIVVRVSIDRTRRARWTRETSIEREIDRAASSSESIETRMVVEQLLDRLTPAARAALVLREMEGLEYGEIATVLRIPVGTVRSRLNAARSQFRKLWLESQSEERCD